MQIDLSSSVAVVTGGGRGLGAAAAARLAAEGATVVVFDLAVERESPGIAWRQVDVTDDAAATAAVAEVVAEHGRVDVLVNCAGVIGPLGPVQEVDAAQWRRTLEINLTGTFVMCAAVLPGMVERGEGRIVNFASAAGVENQAGQAPYNASKAGVISLTKTIAREVHRDGVRINAICPANVETPLIEEFLEQDLSAAPEYVQANQRAHGEASAEGLSWEPHEVMDLIVFLASPAGSHVSGQFVRMASKGEPGVYN